MFLDFALQNKIDNVYLNKNYGYLYPLFYVSDKTIDYFEIR